MGAQTIESISEFLLHAGTNFQVVDMGRGLTPIDAQTFLDLENGKLLVPRPRQQHAWFAIVFWNTSQTQAKEYIWFLKLPVDEQGLVVTATRNHFLQIIVDALGSSLADDTEQGETLPDNPYNFVPPQTLMAHFNALIRHVLNKPAVTGTADVERYIRHPAVMDWQTLSIQAIADCAYHIEKNQLDQPFTQHFSLYAADFQQTYLSALEHVALPQLVQNYLLAWLDRHGITSEESAVALAVLRALSCDEVMPEIQQRLAAILAASELNMDVLSVIAARHFNQLNDTLLLAFFEHAAKLDTQQQFDGALFKGFFADLVSIPTLRTKVLGLLRSTERSETLARAIGALFSATRGN